MHCFAKLMNIPCSETCSAAEMVFTTDVVATARIGEQEMILEMLKFI